MLLIELFAMQDYKVQHPLKRIQVIFHLWQRIMKVFNNDKKVWKISKTFNGIQSDHLKMNLKIVT